MPTVAFIGPGLSGRTTTIEAIARSRSFTLSQNHSDAGSVLLATGGSMRFVTAGGNIYYHRPRRRSMLEADAVVFTVDIQPERREACEEVFALFRGEISLAPRLYQLNKADLVPAASARAWLPAIGWEEGMWVYETTAHQGVGLEQLFTGIESLLDAKGLGDIVRRPVHDAFPGRAAELLRTLEQRWLGWGRRRIVECLCGAAVVVQVGSAGGAVVALADGNPLQGGAHHGGFLPPLPVTVVSRDSLLADLNRALSPAEFERVERGCGRDVEDRDVVCPGCGRALHVRATFDGADWLVSFR